MHASPQLLSGYNTGASERVAYDAKDERIRYQEAALGERQEVAGTASSQTCLEAAIRAVRATSIAAARPALLQSTTGRATVPPDQISVCSEISKASSTSMPRYRTVDSSLECPSSNCTARRFFVRR